MMKIENISQQTRDKILPIRYDRIIEKHEGPFTWKSPLGSHELDEAFMKFFQNMTLSQKHRNFLK